VLAGVVAFAAPAAGQPVPPPASPVADANAPAVVSGLASELQSEIDRAAAVRADLQSRLDDIAGEDRRQNERFGEANDRIGALALRLKTADPGTTAVDGIYEDLVRELVSARGDLDAALEAWRSPPPVSRFAPRLDPEDLVGTPLEPQARTLMRLDEEIDEIAERLERDRLEPLWRAVETDGEVVARLNDLRIHALPTLTEAKRDRLLGFSREGLDQLRREVRQLTLSAKLYVATRMWTLKRLPSMSGDLFALGAATLILLKLLLILALLLYIRGRGARILAGARQIVFDRTHSVRWVRRAEALLGMLEVVAPWLVMLIAFRLLLWALGAAGTWPEVLVVYRLAVLYVAYRLAIDISYSMIVKVARRYHLSMDTARRMLLIRSVRTIIRTVTLLGVLFVLSRQLLGPGFLYGLVVDFSWLVVLAAAVRVLNRWRQIIADAYLASAPDGRLAALVRSSRDHWYGVLLAAASFGWLAGRAGAIMARDFALTFDQTRKALAFVFRRRMEKQAEQKGYAEGKIELLPASLVAAFSEKAVSEGPLVVDRFPGLDRLEKSLEEWKAGRMGGSFMVIGEPGMGKTSWLGRVDAGDLPVERLPLKSRLLTGPDLLKAIEPLTRDDGTRRVAMVDAAQNLFLGAVGGYEALEEFVSVVERTRDRIFWLCALNAFSWEHLAAVRPDLAVFRDHQVLTPWSEEAIRELIRTRTTASGVNLTFEDLVVERMEGVSAEARFLRTEEGYTRLLWDYADGNPRIALHFWLRSLGPDSDTRARVRLFRAPVTQRLERTAEEGLFVLAAIVTHENLSGEEAALVTGYPGRICAIHLDRLVEMGVLRLDDGRHRVRTHWHKAVTRLLSRRNLLPD